MEHFIVEEILQKENERFQLEEIGFVENIRKGINQNQTKVSLDSKDSFISWRKNFLSTYYISHNFESFFATHKEDKKCKNMVFNIMKTYLNKLFQSSKQTEVDYYLAPSGKTLSYLIDTTDFEKILAEKFNIKFSEPSVLSNLCKNIAQEIYPLEFHDIIERLKDNRTTFWDIFCIRLKKIVIAVTNPALKSYQEETIINLWTDTGIELRSALEKNRLTAEIGAKGFAAFSAGIARNKLRELFRRQKSEPLQMIEDWDTEVRFKDLMDTEEDSNTENSSFDLSDIDRTNAQECKMALSCILCDAKHPMYKQLTEGLEDKISILAEHYIEDRSYEEIAKRIYGEMSDSDLKKRCDKLRQDVTRVKSKVKERFEELLNIKLS